MDPRWTEQLPALQTPAEILASLVHGGMYVLREKVSNPTPDETYILSLGNGTFRFLTPEEYQTIPGYSGDPEEYDALQYEESELPL